jgi:excisionase family DNA binding protein
MLHDNHGKTACKSDAVEAVAQALFFRLAPLIAAMGGDAAPVGAPKKLCDRAELARLLSVSPSTVSRLVRKGLPYVQVGDARRYDYAAALTWLAQRSGR